MEAEQLKVNSRSRDGGLAVEWVLPAALLALAALCWWWSEAMAPGAGEAGSGMGEMSSMEAGMSLGGFLVAWLAMMAAMMLPAVLPVVRLYGQAAARGRAAPTGFFVFGYLAVWTAMAAPAYFAWRALEAPIAEGRPWAARVAGVALLVAAVWQLTPLKAVCLRHCRSPLSFFLRFGSAIQRPAGAMRMGAAHGGFCLGCCWALFAVLVALGTMNLVWMVILTALIVLEKNARHGVQIARLGAAGFAVLGGWLLLDTSLLMHVT